MTPYPCRVLIVLAEGVESEAARLTAELLEEFGVSFEEISMRIDAAETRSYVERVTKDVSIIIVASPDIRIPKGLAGVNVPIIRVPVTGVNSLRGGLSLLWNPEEEAAGEGVATVAIGNAGARNAALFAVSMLAAQGDERLREAWSRYRQAQTDTVLSQTLPV